MATATDTPLTLAAVDPGRLYSVHDLAAVYGRCVPVAERWCRAGKVKAKKVGGRWAILGAEILRLYGEQVLAHQVPTGPTERERRAEIAREFARLEQHAKRRATK